MVLWHERSRRKPTGGLYRDAQKRRLMDRGGEFVATTLGERLQEVSRGRGGNEKFRLRRDDKVSYTDPKTKKTAVAKIEDIYENSANMDYIRRDVITKGAVLLTAKGLVKVTSRPGQDGVVCGVLVGERPKSKKK